MTARVNLIVACAKRKTRRARPDLRLRDVAPTSPIESRASAWIARLQAASPTALPAADLYCGDHWSVVRSIAAEATGAVRVWICSAGYGLVGWESRLAPYEATFSSGRPDSVVPAGARGAAAVWWRRLSEWEGPPATTHRSVAAVAASFPDDFLLVALSERYLAAIANDLRAAAARLATPDRFALICAGAKDSAAWAQHLLPCDSRLQHRVGGALASLNARLASCLIAEGAGARTLSAARELFARWSDAAPARSVRTGIAASDDELRAFIRRRLARNPALRATPLLQSLRAEGRACEHRRFVRLFAEVREGGPGAG